MRDQKHQPVEFDNTQAFTEGWGIFSMHPPFHDDEPYQLEAVANEEIGPTSFADLEEPDQTAVNFVIERARAGSAYHAAALRWLAEHSPRELRNFPQIAETLVTLSQEGTMPEDDEPSERIIDEHGFDVRPIEGAVPAQALATVATHENSTD